MQALHCVGSGPLLGSVQSSGVSAGAAGGAAGLESCDDGTGMVFDFDTLTRNQIRREQSGWFWCALCWKTPCDVWQLEMHLKGDEHLRRMRNFKYEENPLVFVPSPHREVTVLLGGWPTCRICSGQKRMDEGHWKSAKHQKNLKSYLEEQQNVLLPQLSRPPELVGDSVVLEASSIASMTSVCGDHKPAASDSCGQSVQGLSMFDSARQRNLVAVSCGSVASQLLCRPLPLLSMDSSVPGQSSLRPDRQYPWGSRGVHDEVLREDEWDDIVRNFDKRYAGEWWPIDMEWEFYDV